ncbi:MAG: hypothetical protein J7L71_01970 [Spirochaetaceae bacterium]|nr:hypothetical protein [Spirochaetaceae bacterium]
MIINSSEKRKYIELFSKNISILGGYHGHTGFTLAAEDEQYKEPFGSMTPGFKQIPLEDINAVKSAITNKTGAPVKKGV